MYNKIEMQGIYTASVFATQTLTAWFVGGRDLLL